MNLLPTSSLLPPAGSCDRMLGVHAHEALSSPPSLDSYTGDAVRATGGWPCLHPPCVSSRAHHPAHHPAHYIAHGHMQRRAYMGALAHVYMRNVAYAHSTSLTRHTCAHMRTCTCTQPDRPLHTHRRDITGKTHPDTHMHKHEKHVRTNSCLHTHIQHTKEHALIQTYTQPHTRTHAQLHTHTKPHTQREKDRISHEQNAHIHKRAYIQAYTQTFAHAHACTHTHLVTHLHTTKPRKYS